MHVKSISDERLDKLGEEYTRRLRQGDHPSLEEFTAGYGAEQAAEIEAFLESVALLEELKHATDEDAADAQELPRIFGRYKIGRTLGVGGMGAVYLAVDTQLDREVALKTPRLSRCSSPDFIERFYREAKSAATLRHPNICPVYDVGKIDGIHYLSMAYIPGRSLAELLEQEETISTGAAVQIASQVASALQEAHHQGVIHRDLKPANIMIDQRGEPVVTDFGLARPVAETAPDEPDELVTADPANEGDTSGQNGQLTQAGAILGSPGYMAPEQFRSDAAATGVGTDVFALGVVLYEMLTGTLPRRVDGEVVLEVDRRSKETPSGLLAICQKAMAAEPRDRVASMDAFAAALSGHSGKMSANLSNRKSSRLAKVAVFAAVLMVGVLLVAGAGVFMFRPPPGFVPPHEASPAHPAGAFMVFDTDNDGALSEAELNAADTRMHPPDSPLRRAISRFRYFDSNGDGRLEPDELRRIILRSQGPEHRRGPPHRGRRGGKARVQH